MYVRTSSAASWSMWATWGNRRCRVAQTWSSCRPAAARSGWAKMVRTRAAIGPWACLGSFCRSAPGYAAQSAPAKISEIARSGPLVGIRDHQPHPSQPPPRTRSSRWPPPPPRADSETAPSLQIRETSLRLQPSSPRARTRSSTFRVLTPAQGRLLHHAHQRPLRPPAGLQQAREVAPLPQLGNPQGGSAPPGSPRPAPGTHSGTSCAPESARTGPPPPAQTPPAPSAPPPTAAPPPATRPRLCPPGVERNSSNSAILNSGAAGGIHIPTFELVFA
jgi:hypothetical protein